MLTKLEIKRKSFHILTGILIVLFALYTQYAKLILVGIFIIGLLTSILSGKHEIPILGWFLKNFDRKNEPPERGAILFLFGSILVLYIFPQEIALASILILAFGDGIATIIGKTSNKKGKTLRGTLAGGISAIIASSFFISLPEATIASIFAMTAENRVKDYDNVLVPLTAAIIISLLRII